MGRARAVALLALVLLLVLAACAGDAPQDALVPEGEFARRADSLFKSVFWITVVPIFVIVEGMLLFAVLKFRQKSDEDAPVQVHGNTRLEVVWTIIPAVILAVVAVPTVRTIFDFAARPSGDVLEVEVVAHQWWWEYRYPGLGDSPLEPLVTANELHIPVGRPVYLTMNSEDVVHSFWVPKLAGKQDVVPGRENHLTLKADRPGTYMGQCAEYCGLSHANMRLLVIAQDEGDFDAWVDAQRRTAPPPADPEAARGMDLFVNGQCAGCHAVRGTNAAGKIGPDLTHLMSRETFAGAIFQIDHDNLTRWVRDAPAMKPMQAGVGNGMPGGIKDMGLSEDDVRAIVAFLETLE